MLISPGRINWLRAQHLISIVHEEHWELCRARHNTSRLGFILRSARSSQLSVEESGSKYEVLIREIDARIRQLETRLSYLSAYAARYAPLKTA